MSGCVSEQVSTLECVSVCFFVYGVLVHECILGWCAFVGGESVGVVCILYGVLVHVCILEFVSVLSVLSG